MQFLFILSILILTGISHLDAASVSIFNANLDGDPQKWHPRGKGYEVKVIAWPDMVPGNTLHISYPASSKENEWPAVIMHNPDLQIHEWRDFESLDMEFFIEGKDTVPLKVHFAASNGRGGLQLSLKPGRTTISIPKSKIDQQIDCGKLEEIHLYLSKPTRRYTVNLGSVRLSKIDRRQFAENYKKKLQVLNENYHNSKTNFISKKEKADFDRRINEFSSYLHKSTADIRNFAIYRAHCKKAFQDLKSSLQTAVFRARAGKLPLIWIWASPMSKILLDGSGLDSLAADYTISLAKGDAEGATLVIYPLVGLTDLTWETSDFVSSDGRVLKSANISVFPCGYIKCGPTPYMRKNNVYRPDPILTYCNRLNIKKLTYQSFYVEINSLLKQHSGIFTGRIIFRSKGKVIAKIPLQVKIWDFSLKPGSTLPIAVSWREPYQPELIPSVYMKDPAQKQEYIDFVNGKISRDKVSGKETAVAIAIRKKLIDMMLEHRLSPDSLYRRYPPSLDELKYIVSKGTRHFNIGHIPTILLRILAEKIPLYRKNKLLDKAYIYVYDEAGSRLWPHMRIKLAELKRKLRELNADIPIMTTTFDSTFGQKSRLSKLVDIWVVPLDIYHNHLNAIEKARKAGKTVWWYTACGPFSPYPNFFIEYPSIGQRLLVGIMSQKYNNQGYLYYSLLIWKDYWQDANKKWHSKSKTKPMSGTPIVSYDGYSYKDYNGDGTLIYPGPQGAVPSLRLKQFRDGLEDYQYVELIKDIMQKTNDEKIREEAGKILRSAYAFIKDDFSYDTDTDKFIKVREAMGDFISKYSKK